MPVPPARSDFSRNVFRMGWLCVLWLCGQVAAGSDSWTAWGPLHGLSGNPALLEAADGAGWLLRAQWWASADDYSVFAGAHGENLGVSFYQIHQSRTTADTSRWSWIWNSGSSTTLPLSIAIRSTWERSSAYRGNRFLFSPGAWFSPHEIAACGWFWEHALTTGAAASQPSAQWFGLTLKTPSSSLFVGLNRCVYGSACPSTPNEISWGVSVFSGIEMTGKIQFRTDAARAAELQLQLPLGNRHHIGFGKVSRTDQYFAQVSGYLRPRALNAPPVVRLALNQPISESPNPWPWLNPSSISLADLRRQFQTLAQYSSLRAVIIDFDQYQGNATTAWEVRRGITALRNAGKNTIAYLTDVRPGTLLAASAAHHIAVQPSARVHFRGLASEALYFKPFLDKLGVQIELIRHGRWKSAVEPWTADSMSDEARENLHAVLQDLWNTVRDSIASARRISPVAIDSAALQPDLTAFGAVKTGLVDTILYWDDLSRWLQWNGPIPVWDIRHGELRDESWGPRELMAVLHIEGEIVSGRSGSGWFMPQSAGDQDLTQLIDQLRRDREIRALIVRIHSPGGSAQASDIIWHRLRRLREELNIPVIASVGGMAASGGYYIACAADQIVAEPTSITGSIGVFGGKLNLSGLLQKLGIRPEITKTHPSSDAESPFRPLSEHERQILQAGMDDFYQRFVHVVATARRLSPRQLDSLAEGRVFSGAQAMRVGLVDQLGGLDTAIRLAARQAGISSERHIRIVYYGAAKSRVEYGKSFSSALLNNGVLNEETGGMWALWFPGIDRE